MNSEKSLKSSRNFELVFKHDVTRDELIKSLDSILNHYGCPGCGLNGRSISWLSDPDPIDSRFSRQLIDINPSIVSVNTFVNPVVVSNQGVLTH